MVSYTMPVQRCTINGKTGFKWGNSGKCFVGREGRSKARRQGRAISASKSRKKKFSWVVKGKLLKKIQKL